MPQHVEAEPDFLHSLFFYGFYPDSISRIRFMSLQNVLLQKAEDESLDFHYTFYFFTRIRPSFLHKLTL